MHVLYFPSVVHLSERSEDIHLCFMQHPYYVKKKSWTIKRSASVLIVLQPDFEVSSKFNKLLFEKKNKTKTYFLTETTYFHF